jgi:hypothetical protein
MLVPIRFALLISRYGMALNTLLVLSNHEYLLESLI